MTEFEIRRVSGEEILTLFPLQWYAFDSSPISPEGTEERRDALKYRQAWVRLAAFDGDQAQAIVVGIPMRQNVRGTVMPMLGVSGVASHPMARRKGHIRALLQQLHGEFRDEGYAVSTLYPFRPSFYEKFGYAGFPKARSVRLFPDGLDRVERLDVPGEFSFHQIGDVFDEWWTFSQRVLANRHGTAEHPRENVARLGDDNRHWTVFARHDGEIAGAMVYRTQNFGQPLHIDSFQHTGPIGRTLLLQWIARHRDQFASFELKLAPDEKPDLWYTDVRYDDETEIKVPTHSAPAGRILSVEGLSGIAAGPAAVTVEVVDDPFVGGVWSLDGTGGALEVKAGGGSPTATLTANGLSALVYGTLDPVEVDLRGYGTVDESAAAALRVLFPPAVPYLRAEF
ncbi:GNAT family N-acetyltransferase [Flindersiella endophytica]